jgi:diguanylate cyclase (GGDEF)-like protein
MSDNAPSVLLISDDRQLRALVESRTPPKAVLHLLGSPDVHRARALSPDSTWMDLDCPVALAGAADAARVYLFSSLNDVGAGLRRGVFIRKPASRTVVDLLWARAVAEHAARGTPAETLAALSLPAWLAELHVPELRELCCRIVTRVPARLGYARASLYLFQPESRLLTLAETTRRHAAELAISLDDMSNLIATAARSREVVEQIDGGEPPAPRKGRAKSRQEGSQSSCLITPLVSDEQLCGVLVLSEPQAEASASGMASRDRPLAFIGRCLHVARQVERARSEARVDELTGLYNYRWLMETLERETQRAERYGAPLSLLLVDLDRFKTVNDRYGHVAGNCVLRHVAAHIRSSLRQIDSASRVGGDEFVVLFPGTGLRGAQLAAERLRRGLRDNPPMAGGEVVSLTASIGAAAWRKGWNAERLLEAADQAMYGLKKARPLFGRGRKASVTPPNNPRLPAL